MIRRHRSRTLVLVLCSMALAGSVARGALTNAIKTSAAPATYAGQIKAYIDATAKDLISADPAVQQRARKLLIDEVENHTGGAASPQFQAEYAKHLNKALLNVLQSSKEVHVRVNVAIIADGVAARVYRGESNVAPLTPLIQKLLSDPQTAVVLWGIKAAKYDIGDAIAKGANPAPLAKLVVKAMSVHGDAGCIVEEAYNALTLDQLNKLKGNPQFAGMVAPLIPSVLDLLALRTQQYRNGMNPPSPEAERVVTVFLSVTAFPAISANPALLNRTLKEMGELTCETVHSLVAGNTSQELVAMVREYGSFFSTIGTQMQNADIQSASKFLSAVSLNEPNTMDGACKPLASALKAVGVTLNSEGSAGNPADNGAQPAIAGSTK